MFSSGAGVAAGSINSEGVTPYLLHRNLRNFPVLVSHCPMSASGTPVRKHSIHECSSV